MISRGILINILAKKYQFQLLLKLHLVFNYITFEHF